MSIGRHGSITTDEAPLLERKTRLKSLTVSELCSQYIEVAEQRLIIGRGARSHQLKSLTVQICNMCFSSVLDAFVT